MNRYLDPLERIYKGFEGPQAWNALLTYQNPAYRHSVFNQTETEKIHGLTIIAGIEDISAHPEITSSFFLHISPALGRSAVMGVVFEAAKQASKALQAGNQFWRLTGAGLVCCSEGPVAVYEIEDIIPAIYAVDPRDLRKVE